MINPNSAGVDSLPVPADDALAVQSGGASPAAVSSPGAAAGIQFPGFTFTDMGGVAYMRDGSIVDIPPSRPRG